MSHPFVLILAGGSGERFWPLSRKARPKQLLKLFSDRTLLEETLHRLEHFTTLDRVLILTNQEQAAAVRELTGSLIPAENIVAEPAKRDTAPAIALAVGWVARRDPSATMIVLPADHVIKDAAAFQRDLQAACDAVKRDPSALVTIGIKPTWACPGFGYIELGEQIDERVRRVTRFREKPAPELAQQFVEEGFRWNAGMFVWSIPAILGELHRQAPALADFATGYAHSPDPEGWLQERFPQLPKISIDYAVMEKAFAVLMVEASFDWDDVGGWPAIASYLQLDEQGNSTNRPVAALDSSNNLIFSSCGRQVALLGVSDLLIVQTDDALLICPRNRSEQIKQLIPQLAPELH
ncbi:MAG: NTP transferase domain-containing protein [Verrucomicrobia bacterium]|nr:NTP transferase domain-containing protein [Verrucomicrobiota bacterium]